MRTLSINGKFLAQRTTGVQRYAAEVVHSWDEMLLDGRIDRTQFRIRLFAPRNLIQFPQYRYVELIRCNTGGRIWEQLELPWRSKRTLLFSPFAAAPVLKHLHAVTIHDAGVSATPEQYSAQFRAFYRLVFRILGRMCDPVFTVSEFSKRELGNYFGIPEAKMKVIPPGCDYIQRVPADETILKRCGLNKDRYVLAVSSQSIIKNFQGVQRAWKLLARQDMKLAIAGGSNPKLFGHDAKGFLAEGVLLLGYVSDSELRALYENAALFAYPSFYEGFGLPPIEAMQCGCPVLVAQSSALPEVCGDAAAYCDPMSVDDIARSIARVLDDPHLAEKLRERGRSRAKLFTSARTAELLWTELRSRLQS